MKIKIADNTIIPIYYQIYEQLKDCINNHKILPGVKLPSERELKKLLGVSRITIRKAMNNLIADGFCYKERGKGIFVLGEKIYVKIDFFKGMGNYIESLGLKIRNQVMDKKIIQSDAQLTQKLKVPIKSKILYLKRLRIIEDNPLIVEDTYLSLNRINGLEDYELSGSLYKVLREKYHIFPDHSEGTIINRLVNSNDANILNIPLNYPIFEKKAVVFDRENIPIEYVRGIYHSNRFVFVYNSYSK